MKINWVERFRALKYFVLSFLMKILPFEEVSPSSLTGLALTPPVDCAL